MEQLASLDSYSRSVEAFQHKNWQQAHEMAAQQMRLTPNHAGSCYIAGLAALELQQVVPALKYLNKAMHLDPQCADYAVQYAKALSLANAAGEALRTANRAINLSPTDPLMFDTLGVVYTRCQAHERAASAFRRAVSMAPGNAIFRFNFAMSLMYAGDLDGAQAELEMCLTLRPDYWLAHFTLSRLHRQTPSSNHVDQLRSLADQSKSDSVAQIYLHMALGKEYEDLGDYSKAFEHFVKGKSAVSSSRVNEKRNDEALFSAIAHAFDDDQGTSSKGYATDEPIFVLGMPRSGTTLVERIISSHPHVYSAGELPNFGLALKHVSGTRTPQLLDVDTIAQTPNINWEQLGEKYLSSTRPLTDAKPHFIDKLPHNFLYLGFIAKALPNAKIICLQRNPMDTCLSNFRELFAQGSEFHDYSMDLLDTGRYFILFDRLMNHWKRIFPGRILEVNYESLVASQEASTRQLLDYCNLPWSDACLRFEQNDTPTTTASSVQVRAPIYHTAVQRWRKYAAQLRDLQALLADAGIDVDPIQGED
jgi:Sulfotransferase family